MREILTLQLGQLSNYTATHFWNTQESYFSYDENAEVPIDHDVFWRQGLGADGSETFLPRTVIYDLKGGFGSLRKINALYEPEQTENPATLWPGRTVIQKQDQIEQSAYQQALDTGSSAQQPITKSSVRYWSDFSRVFYHPKSLNQLYDYELDSTIRPFDHFAAGADLYSTLNKDEDILDRDFRPFVEECDHMQGIQVFTGIDDAWGGFASEYLEGLRDEYPKTCVWTWGIQAPTRGIPRQQRQLRLSNVAQSLNSMCSTASMVIPLAVPPSGTPPSVNLDTSSPWHVSALMSAAIETTTLPLRLKHRLDGQRPASLDELTELINTNGQQTLARLQLGVGDMTETPEDNDTLEAGVDLFGFGDRSSGKARGGVRRFGQITSNRGSDAAQEEPEAGEHDETKRPIPGQSIIRKYTSPLSYPMLDSYPIIYRDATHDSPVDMQTVLSTDTSMRAALRQLRSQTAWVLPSEERETLTNGLDELADAYQDDWSSGSDDDDDDD